MNKTKKIFVTILAVSALVYGSFLIKKAFFDKGYYSEEDEKEVLLGYYVILKGLPNNKQNRDRFSSMSLDSLRKELGITNALPK